MCAWRRTSSATAASPATRRCAYFGVTVVFGSVTAVLPTFRHFDAAVGASQRICIWSKVPVPAAPPLRFNLRFTFAWIAAHKRRHLWLARQVRIHTAFPAVDAGQDSSDLTSTRGRIPRSSRQRSGRVQLNRMGSKIGEHNIRVTAPIGVVCMSGAPSRRGEWDGPLVGAAGLEPATLCLEGRCSIRLSYAPIPASPFESSKLRLGTGEKRSCPLTGVPAASALFARHPQPPARNEVAQPEQQQDPKP